MDIPTPRKIEPLLNVRDVMARLSISESTAYNLMSKELPVIRFGKGVVRVQQIDLEKYIEAHRDDHQGDQR